MISRFIQISVFILLFTTHYLSAANVGLLIMATGRYVNFVQPLIDSADKYFCKNHNVTYFVFTDGKLKNADNVEVIYQARLGWPYDTMMRYNVYYNARDAFSEQDYLFALDADMLFVDFVGDEILSDRVATLHPGFINKRGSYETSIFSTACVFPNEGKYYFAGGFYGGSTKDFLNIALTNLTNINTDLSKGIIAVWHDESHWNRYCINHPPTLILTPSYCYPESWDLNYPKKILALDKNHSEFQTK